MVIEVGAKAPDFALPATNGATIKLSDYKGRRNVALVFYPLDFTPV
jgi:peroxiredoxin Q/BCP